jgi:hypothetical protein
MFGLFLVARPDTFIKISRTLNNAYRMIGDTRLAMSS